MPTHPVYWSTQKEDAYVGAYIADSEQLLKIYQNNDKLKLSGLFWTLEVTKKGKPGQADDTYKVVDFANGKILKKKEGKRDSTQGLFVIVF